MHAPPCRAERVREPYVSRHISLTLSQNMFAQLLSQQCTSSYECVYIRISFDSLDEYSNILFSSPSYVFVDRRATEGGGRKRRRRVSSLCEATTDKSLDWRSQQQQKQYIYARLKRTDSWLKKKSESEDSWLMHHIEWMTGIERDLSLNEQRFLHSASLSQSIDRDWFSFPKNTFLSSTNLRLIAQS